MEIYCPKCEWEPPASAEWTCECGHAWHTFDTQGQCPECGKVWRQTQCHECHAWSPHHDWYHDLPSVDVDAITEGEGAAPASHGAALYTSPWQEVLLAAATTLLLVGCDLFVDPPPYEISVERPRDRDTLLVGTPFHVEARLEGDRTIQSAEVAIYRNLGTSEQDTVFSASLPVPPNRKTLHVDTILTMERLPGPPGDDFHLLARLHMKDRGGGRGSRVTILESRE